jgi:hypothetical protein
MNKRKPLVIVILFLLILGVALFLRIRRLDTTGIWEDQSIILDTAMQWVNGGTMPLAANKSSLGFMHLPLIEYLYAAALRIWHDILSVAILTMISGMVAILITGWATYKVFGWRPAFWTTLFFAVNPWSVFYSQLIWNPTLLPVFSSLTFASLLLYFAHKQRPIYLISGLVGMACMIQIHPGAGIQLLSMAIIFAILRRKLQIRPLVIGGVLSMVLYVPYLLYEIKVNWNDVKTLLESFHDPVSFSLAAPLVSMDFLHAQGLLGSVKHIQFFDMCMTVLFGGSLLYTFWIIVSAFVQCPSDQEMKQKVTAFCILLIWFILPILFYLRSSHYLQMHYFIGQVPAHFILIGVCLDGVESIIERLAARARRRSFQHVICLVPWIGLLLLTLALAAWQIGFNMQFQDARFHGEANKETQIRHVRDVIRTANQLLAERPPCALVVASQGYNFEMSKLSLLGEFTSAERVVLTDGRWTVLVPESCGIYLDALPESKSSAWLAAEATVISGAEIHVLQDVWRFYDLPETLRSEVLGQQEERATWENGAALIYYARGAVIPGAGLPLSLTWTIKDPLPLDTYHLGTYLLTMNDQLVAQSDGPGLDSLQWQEGDSFITWFDLPVPQELSPDRYRIALSLYRWPEVKPVPFLSGENVLYLEDLQFDVGN